VCIKNYLTVFAAYLKLITMALEIKSPPVFEGKAAREFYKRWAESKDDTSKEVAQESMRQFKSFWFEQEKLRPSW